MIETRVEIQLVEFSYFGGGGDCLTVCLEKSNIFMGQLVSSRMPAATGFVQRSIKTAQS